MTRSSKRRYLPALGYDWLTGLYDPLVRLTLPEITIKEQLIEQARIEPEHTVVDIGCGTGTLLILVRSKLPLRAVVGLDGDAKILGIAAGKLRRSGTEVGLIQGLSFDLPFADGTFDRALSSLTLHHLTRLEKLETLSEVFRILRPGGELHVADWGRPHNPLMRILSTLERIGDGLERTADNVAGRLPEFFGRVGFDDACEVDRFATVFGTLTLYQARKP